jgi:hypothetical protein
MIRRSQYRCSFRPGAAAEEVASAAEKSRTAVNGFVGEGKLCNVSFYKYENIGFLYVEEIVDNEDAPMIDIEDLMKDLNPVLKPWPREEGDRFFAPMINVYYHHIPDRDIDIWEKERTTAQKTRIGRIAFVFPDKLPSYVMYHTAIVNEGLWKGDKYAFISLHENILFSYYEEPRNNVNIKDMEEESEVIKEWMKADPESHFDRVKAKGENFLVIPCLFTVDRIDK